ncbi:MAG: hypothetical protein WCO56_13695 [Verrucomicrobiota bacterium]
MKLTRIGLTIGWLAGWLVVLAGCADKSTIETRKHERWMAYSGLPQEQRELVDQGKIRMGMTMDAVFIAWGKPSEETEAESAEGHTVTWRYHSGYGEETRYWTFREVTHDGKSHMERYLDTDYTPRSYVRSEIVFLKNKVIRWQTLPRPL